MWDTEQRILHKERDDVMNISKQIKHKTNTIVTTIKGATHQISINKFCWALLIIPEKIFDKVITSYG